MATMDYAGKERRSPKIGKREAVVATSWRTT
jgi:hypothetical protein